MAINDAFEQLPHEGEYTWFQTRWSRMRPDQQYKWVERRMAPLMVIWAMGGAAGFSGLEQRLDAALHQIDR
ncbi:hypothetical protein [Phaeobacter piscinae]|uniref:hypothetical protein n=1 Tax=Phaeobacter piscinae TaxID=1580596 RepID=UPI000598D548|nr:hypothetical protein [Phaeobacter piscinae]UTS82230.1 hypothetical protein OL67_003334 [Phaeobacter piscinae]